MSIQPHTRRRPVALAATLALAAGLLASPLAASDAVVVEPVPSVAPELPAADPGTTAPAVEVAAAKKMRPCRVTLDGTRYTSLRSAEAAAVDGDTLTVAGRCVGFTEVDTDITIVGTRVKGLGRPTLSGGRGTQVLSLMHDTAVTVRGLTIRDGIGVHGGAIYLLDASIELIDVRLIRNRGTGGGAIYGLGSTVELSGKTRIARNTAGARRGGGVHLEDGSTFIMRDRSRVTRNRALSDNGGGVALYGGGTFEMHDRSRIDRNIVDDDNAGAAVAISGGVLLTMNDFARIDHNVGYSATGGISAGDSTVTMNDRALIDRNVGDAGGVYAETLVMNDDSRIVRNSGELSGGAWVRTALTMNDRSTIANNRGRYDAGGLKLEGAGRLNDTASIRDNFATEHGGGVYVEPSGHLTIADSARVTGNRAMQEGGGVYADDGYGSYRGAVTIEGSGVIRDNLARAAANGAGISHCGATLTGVTALTNVLDNLAPNGPVGAPPADVQVWNRCP